MRVEQLPGGLELVVHGGEDRERLARRVVEQRDAVSGRALRLMGEFLRESFTADGFHLDAIEVLDAGGPGDVVLTYSFSPDGDPHAYGYTHFDVVLAAREPPADPFWPVRLTVGFH